jgi:alkylhydroperoxidase/carboxymuconolactone decarboxylase family protein YurZ
VNALHEYLSNDQLRRLRAAYDRTEMLTAIGVPLPALLPRSRQYIDTIEDAFYSKETGAAASAEIGSLSVRERELCLLVLLATHHSQHNLGIHVYLGLMEGISPREIGSVFLLTAIYSGEPVLATGLRTAAMTLGALGKTVAAHVEAPADNPLNPIAILEVLKKTFPYV